MARKRCPRERTTSSLPMVLIRLLPLSLNSDELLLGPQARPPVTRGDWASDLRALPKSMQQLPSSFRLTTTVRPSSRSEARVGCGLWLRYVVFRMKYFFQCLLVGSNRKERNLSKWYGFKRLNSESWPRAGNPGHDSCKTDFTGTSILAPRLVC